MFRIRIVDMDSDEYDDLANSDRAYRQHLEKYLDIPNTDLLKYFYYDFFHDGCIDSLQFTKDCKSVEMKITCPNIEQRQEDGSWKYINVPFVCHFEGVNKFDLTYDPPEAVWHSRLNDICFLRSEINTSPLLNTYNVEDDEESPLRYSLLMRLFSDDSDIWVEIVFYQVTVEPCEPTSFALMEVDPNFKVNTYSKGE